MTKHPELSLDHFTPGTITKADSHGKLKAREIMMPDEEATEAHNAALKRMYEDGLVDNPWATGSIPGKSLIDNIAPHQSNDMFLLLDITNAFSQVRISRLKEIFKDMYESGTFDQETLNYYNDFLDTYASSFRAKGLPQGAPCSPYLFNVYCQPMDFELGEFCEQYNLTYTRWLDDITISSPQAANALSPAIRKKIRGIIESHNLPINHTKSKLHSLSNGPVTITGISLYPNGRIQPSPNLIDKMFKEFAEIEAAIPGASDDELFYLKARLSGWNGVLESMTMPGAPKSENVIRAKRLYQELSATAKLLFRLGAI